MCKHPQKVFGKSLTRTCAIRDNPLQEIEDSRAAEHDARNDDPGKHDASEDGEKRVSELYPEYECCRAPGPCARDRQGNRHEEEEREGAVPLEFSVVPVVCARK